MRRDQPICDARDRRDLGSEQRPDFLPHGVIIRLLETLRPIRHLKSSALTRTLASEIIGA